MEVVRELQKRGWEAVVSTRPPGLEVVLGKYTLRRRIGVDEVDVQELTVEVALRAAWVS